MTLQKVTRLTFNSNRTPTAVCLWLQVALTVAGCSNEPTVNIGLAPVPPETDARIGPQDAYIQPDLAPPTMFDLGRPDALPMDGPLPDAHAGDTAIAGDAGDGGVATDVLLEPDASLTAPPPRGQIVIIPQAADTFLAWTRGGQLWVRCLKGAACLEPRPVAVVSNGDAPIRSAATQAGIPWVLVNDGATGEVLAYDIKNLDEGQATGHRLGIFGPVAAGVTGLQPRPEIVAVGNVVIPGMGDGAAEYAGFGWRRINNEANAPLRGTTLDFSGLTVPASIVPLNDGVVFGYETGECVKLTTESNPDRVEPRGSWACGLGPLGFLGGRADALFSVTRDAPTATVVLRRATPGHVDDGSDVTARVSLLGLAETWDTNHPRFDDGGLLSVTDGAQTFFWVIRSRLAARFEVNNPAQTVGVAPVGQEFRLLLWDPATSNITDLVVEPSATAVPPTYAAERACGRLSPEVCDARDTDCNGAADEGLCCNNGGERAVSSGTSPAESEQIGALRLPIDELGPVGISDDGLVYIARSNGEILALRHPSDDDSRSQMSVRARWSGYDDLIMSATLRSNALIIAGSTPAAPVMPPDAALPPPDAAPLADAAPAPGDARADAAGPVADALVPPGDAAVVPPRVDLLWLRGREALGAVPSPCVDPVGLRFHGTGLTVRLFCPERVVDLPLGEGQGADVALPPGEPVRWLTRAPFGDNSLLLVSRGAEYTLKLWRDDDNGGLLELEDPLPTLLNNLAAFERTLPISVPGARDATPVRVTAENTLEALLVNGGPGWTRLSGGRDLLRAVVSDREPLAFTLSYTTRPSSADARVGFFVHDLRAGGQPWGKKLDLGDAEDQGVADVHAIAVSTFAPDALFLDLPRFYRVIGGLFTFEGFPVSCSARQ